MKWTSLDAWYDLDKRAKNWFARLGSKVRFRGVAPEALNAWLTAQACLALAIPFVATPLVTWILYPWLPQPDAWLYELAGAMLATLSLVAHHEYKKRQQSAAIGEREALLCRREAPEGEDKPV